MEPISLTALATFLAPFFTEAGKTLAAESVKLALEKRSDIKDGIVNLLKRDEIITLGLNEDNSPDEIKALQQRNPEITASVEERIKESDLITTLLEIIKAQSGNSSITVNAKNIAAAGSVTIQNQTNNFS